MLWASMEVVEKSVGMFSRAFGGCVEYGRWIAGTATRPLVCPEEINSPLSILETSLIVNTLFETLT